MSMHGPYRFLDTSGRVFHVEVVIDPHKIAQALAQKAQRNGNGVTTACAGGVLVKIEKARRLPLNGG